MRRLLAAGAVIVGLAGALAAAEVVARIIEPPIVAAATISISTTVAI